MRETNFCVHSPSPSYFRLWIAMVVHVFLISLHHEPTRLAAANNNKQNECVSTTV